jgi:hypothetical protein
MHRAVSAVHSARARGDASGDAALHVASASVSAENQPGSGPGNRIGEEASDQNQRTIHFLGIATLGRGSQSHHLSAGTTSSTSHRVEVPAFRDRRPQRDQRASSWSLSRRGLPRSVALVGRTLGLVQENRIHSPVVLVPPEGPAATRCWIGNVRGRSRFCRLGGLREPGRAEAYAGGKSRRLPTEAEYHRARFWDAER